MKHTPGPWKTEGWGNIIVNDSEGNTLCLYPQGATHKQTQANAHLIAAAPELLEALIDLVNVSENFPNELSKDHYSVKYAKEAIKKAKGEA